MCCLLLQGDGNVAFIEATTTAGPVAGVATHHSHQGRSQSQHQAVSSAPLASASQWSAQKRGWVADQHGLHVHITAWVAPMLYPALHADVWSAWTMRSQHPHPACCSVRCVLACCIHGCMGPHTLPRSAGATGSLTATLRDMPCMHAQAEYTRRGTWHTADSGDAVCVEVAAAAAVGAADHGNIRCTQKVLDRCVHLSTQYQLNRPGSTRGNHL
jgi:hypothetical protein